MLLRLDDEDGTSVDPFSSNEVDIDDDDCSNCLFLNFFADDVCCVHDAIPLLPNICCRCCHRAALIS